VADVDKFLRDQIDTVPHLEALLLLWHSRPKQWTAEDVAGKLFVKPDVAKKILNDLVRRLLVVGVAGGCETYRYEPETERDQIMTSVDTTYRQELIRVSTLIHSKASSSVQEFARAFKLKKEND
jgi:hypothetical protein